MSLGQQVPAPNVKMATRDDRPTCQGCGYGKLLLIDEGPDPIFGILGMMQQTLQCDNTLCGQLTFL